MEQKSGWKTTEFWVNLVIILVTLFASVMGLLPAALAAKIVAALATVYTIARVVVKLTPTTTDDAVVERIGAALADKLNIKPADPSVATVAPPEKK